MRRMVTLDEMANFDNMLDRFEDLSRHGYSLDRILYKLENDYEDSYGSDCDYYNDDDYLI